MTDQVTCPYCLEPCTHHTKEVELRDSNGVAVRTIQVYWNCKNCGGGELSVKLQDEPRAAP